MKIKKSITKNVTNVVTDCRKTVINAIIELCQTVDRKKSGRIMFESPFVLIKSKINKRGLNFSVDHIIVNNILYGPIDRMDKSFILCYDEGGVKSSVFLSLGDLLIVYEKLKITVLHE